MDFLDERAGLPHPGEGGASTTSSRTPTWGKSAAWTPGRWRTASTSSAWRPTPPRGIMMIRRSNQQQYGTVHGGMLVAFADTIAGHSLVPHGKVCVTQGEHGELPPAGGGGLSLLPGHPGEGGQPHLRGLRGAAQRPGRAHHHRPVHLRGGADHRPGDPAPQAPQPDVLRKKDRGGAPPRPKPAGISEP